MQHWLLQILWICNSQCFNLWKHKRFGAIVAKETAMPLYEYKCKQCGKHTEKIQKFSDAEITECPHCGGLLERVVSAAAISFKGGGWFKDGYSSASAKASGGSESKSDSGAPTASSTEASSSSSKESAPAAAPSAASTPAPAAPSASSSTTSSSSDKK